MAKRRGYTSRQVAIDVREMLSSTQLIEEVRKLTGM
jgi:hypothetical protein